MMKKRVGLVLVLTAIIATSSFAAHKVQPQQAAVQAPPSGADMQKTVATLQQQIKQVRASVPVAVKSQSDATQKQMAQLQKAMQQQITVLQKQIQQVQAEMTAHLQQLQKEIRQVELIK